MRAAFNTIQRYSLRQHYAAMMPVIMLAAIGGVARAGDEITFTRDIAPIVFTKCSSCHQPGQSAPFSLLTFDDVKKRAKQIVEVTASRYMPPWLPSASSDGVHFQGERRLTDFEIATIRAWVETGIKEGVAEHLPAKPQSPPEWPLGEPDLVIEFPEPYTVPADTNDTIRTFVLPLSLPSAQLVKAIDFNPGNRRVVHHASFLVDTTGNARKLDEHEPEPGYRGMGDIGLNLAGSFGGWSPGGLVVRYPLGIGRTLPQSCDLVIEVHFNPIGKSETVQPKVGLYFAKEEIQHQAATVSLGSFFLDIPAGEKRYEVRDTFTLPVDVKALGIAPHAHFICRTVHLKATLPDGSCRELLTITDWDFNWQQDYRFTNTVDLPAGTVMELRMTYDNSESNPRNPNVPPKRVRIGPTAADEMALAFLTVIASDEQDRPVLEQSHHEKLLARMREAQRQRVQSMPQGEQ